MRVLITGGNGFIGGRLADYMQKAGHNVLLGVRPNTFSNKSTTLFEKVTIDWLDEKSIEQSCNNIDQVIHAAGVNAKNSIEDPSSALWFNGVATSALVKAAVKKKVKQFIYCSTAHVYSSRLSGTITEETCPKNLHPYATTHLAGENAVLWANYKAEMKAFVFRISNAFGYPSHEGVNCWMLVVQDLCRQAIENQKMVLRSNGLEQRNFIPVTEVCRVIDFFSDPLSPGLLPGIYNLGSDRSRTLKEIAILIAQRCRDIFGFEPPIKILDKSTINSEMDLHFSTHKLNESGFVFSVDFNNEIDELLRYCQKVFKIV